MFMKLTAILLLGLAGACAFGGQRPIKIECETFENLGGWVLDTQFQTSGQTPYLLAHGLGRPVADAETRFESKNGGVFNVWVRTKNWVGRWIPSPGAGRFKLRVNGIMLPIELGAKGSCEWHWERAGSAKLDSGMNSVALHDVDGFDGRCDAVAFTMDDSEPLECASADEISESRDFELVVVGGGISGICAAIAAARSGLRVALIEGRPVLGGNNSSEVRIGISGKSGLATYPRIGDVVNEIAPKIWGLAQPASIYEDERKRDVVTAETNLSVFVNTHIIAVECRNGRIAAVTGRDSRSGHLVRFAAPLFVDATGDGTVGFLAGADFRYGRESRADTGEPKAPVSADRTVLGATVQWYSVASEDSEFPDIPWALPTLDDASCRVVERGEWNWETGMERDMISEAERIRDYMLLVIYSNWNWLKNRSRSEIRERFSNRSLEWVGYQLGKRESRRLEGDVVLSGNDLVSGREFPDGTCAATWPLDLHEPAPTHTEVFKGEPFISHSPQGAEIGTRPIPYRCLYSRNIDNLFMAGRCASFTHVAHGSIRVMRTCGMMGEVVGLAAAVCRRHACGPREVGLRHFEELRKLLRSGAGAARAR